MNTNETENVLVDVLSNWAYSITTGQGCPCCALVKSVNKHSGEHFPGLGHTHQELRVMPQLFKDRDRDRHLTLAAINQHQIGHLFDVLVATGQDLTHGRVEIGRASCRERV